MPDVGFNVYSGSFAAAAAVHTGLMVIAPAGHGLKLVTFKISGDGVTASAVPLVAEIVQSTQAGAGTPGTTPTAVQAYGRSTGGSAPTAGAAYTAEPTVLTALDPYFLTPNGPTWWEPASLGDEYECDSSGGTIKALGIRVTPSAAVNLRFMMRVRAI